MKEPKFELSSNESINILLRDVVTLEKYKKGSVFEKK
jgi:hypothetical protein